MVNFSVIIPVHNVEGYLRQCLMSAVDQVVDGDELTMCEIGWKQQLWDRRAQINLAVYWADWKNQKGRSSFQNQEDCGSFAHGGIGGASAQNGCQNGVTGLPSVNAAGDPQPNTRNANVGGNSTLKGVECDGAVLLTGTGVVPPAEFTLARGDIVRIAIDGIGELVNPVKVV